MAGQPRVPAASDDPAGQDALSARRRTATAPGLAEIQKLSKAFPGCWFSADDVARNLVFVERPPDCSQELWQFSRECWMIAGGIRERDQLLADQVIERTPRAESPLDRLRGAALLNPNLLEPHVRTIACHRRREQYSHSLTLTVTRPQGAATLTIHRRRCHRRRAISPSDRWASPL